MFRLTVLIAMTLAAIPEAHAYSARRIFNAPLVSAQPAPEGIGCYWERERLFCSRYCYIELDGHRFCRERSREAHSQAPVDEQSYLIPMK